MHAQHLPHPISGFPRGCLWALSRCAVSLCLGICIQITFIFPCNYFFPFFLFIQESPMLQKNVCGLQADCHCLGHLMCLPLTCPKIEKGKIFWVFIKISEVPCFFLFIRYFVKKKKKKIVACAAILYYLYNRQTNSYLLLHFFTFFFPNDAFNFI